MEKKLFRWVQFFMVALFAMWLFAFYKIIVDNKGIIETEYYLPATVCGYGLTDNNEITIFTTENGMYSVDGRIEDDNVFILTMCNNGTDDVSDDFVVCIWEACEPVYG